jgi:hypothetical protein
MTNNDMVRVIYNACYGGYCLSEKAIKRYWEIKGEPQPANWWEYHDLQRYDPILLQVIDEIGLAEASESRYAKLAIRELPRGTKYYIKEYDGYECVVTPKDIKWSIAGE